MADKDVHVEIKSELPEGWKPKEWAENVRVLKELPELTRFADHDYFVIPSVTDVDKIRADAHARSQGDSYGKPESTLVHHHRIGEECYYGKLFDTPLVEQRHDWYPAKKKEE